MSMVKPTARRWAATSTVSIIQRPIGRCEVVHTRQKIDPLPGTQRFKTAFPVLSKVSASAWSFS